MEREEPPPMTSDDSNEVKKDIFDDDEDDELFKCAIESKIPSNSGAANENQGQENKDVLNQIDEKLYLFGDT